MAQDRLGKAFWIQDYLISPLTQTMEQSGADCCIQYRMHISRPRLEREKPTRPARRRRDTEQQKVEEPDEMEAEPPEDWQREVEEEEEEEEEGAEPPEDWQREVEEDDLVEEEEVEPTGPQVHDERESSRTEMRNRKMMMVRMGLPFLTGVSPTGFLSANRKQPGGTDHLVQ
ncbi:ribosomal biogenesis protein LAS1L-like, partial [Etheostoma cragini]|uniref:ribosomal biogenesis protein LAS1L-like n=1 Tax=Etheostoma cragini TaxID=417921 RepID=UPI00155E82E8